MKRLWKWMALLTVLGLLAGCGTSAQGNETGVTAEGTAALPVSQPLHEAEAPLAAQVHLPDMTVEDLCGDGRLHFLGLDRSSTPADFQAAMGLSLEDYNALLADAVERGDLGDFQFQFEDLTVFAAWFTFRNDQLTAMILTVQDQDWTAEEWYDACETVRTGLIRCGGQRTLSRYQFPNGTVHVDEGPVDPAEIQRNEDGTTGWAGELGSLGNRIQMLRLEFSQDEGALSSALSVPADYFYRDGDGGLHHSSQIICYAEPPYAESRDFTPYIDALTAARALPALDYDNCTTGGNYNADGSPWSLYAQWSGDDGADTGAYQQLSLEIWSWTPTEEERARIDGISIFDPAALTRTQVLAYDGSPVDVYGEAQGDGYRTLMWSMPDGSYCELSAFPTCPAEDLAAILDFYMTNGVHYDAYAMDKGDKWASADLSEFPEAFAGCVPTLEDSRLIPGARLVTTKNGEPRRLYLSWRADWWQEGNTQETEDGLISDVLIWEVDGDPGALDRDLGDVNDITRDQVFGAFEGDGARGVLFRKDGHIIRVEKPGYYMEEPTWIDGETQCQWIWQAIASIQTP